MEIFEAVLVSLAMLFTTACCSETGSDPGSSQDIISEYGGIMPNAQNVSLPMTAMSQARPCIQQGRMSEAKACPGSRFKACAHLAAKGEAQGLAKDDITEDQHLGGRSNRHTRRYKPQPSSKCGVLPNLTSHVCYPLPCSKGAAWLHFLSTVMASSGITVTSWERTQKNHWR